MPQAAGWAVCNPLPALAFVVMDVWPGWPSADFTAQHTYYGGMHYDRWQHSICFSHLLKDVVQSIVKNTLYSISLKLQDPFGNYVVQYVLELGHVEATATIMRQLYGQYPELAQQKFSSNVVEKCLKLGGLVWPNVGSESSGSSWFLLFFLASFRSGISWAQFVLGQVTIDSAH